ncbi:IucA/IucC family siderophore biosynthesis protein [Actinomadura kijaniata]|uniref:DNA polymerase-3 subunit chi n=1 Tax=Actinomadura namibiensis TaxID=182080 RepID=A0A7W3LXH4_ACTNM|nr:IucA/IucC family protein [Actinomadura namibiensis]MBA8956076.1 DNA polymerase-3 subunit chi [Actinomadura namibiensis]
MRPFETEFAADLRPDLADAYRAALPGARAGVLARLWRGLCVDPLPRVAGRRRVGAETVLTLTDGRRLAGPSGDWRFPEPTADRPVTLDGRRHEHPAELLSALAWPEAERLRAEIDHSVAGLALARANAVGPAAPFPRRTPVEHEQSVVDGHPLHPCCRNRTGFLATDHLAHGPEHGPVVGLDLLAVPPDACLARGSWPAELREGDALLLPLHPWQSRHVLPRLGLAPHRPGALPAHPLMALRTFALDGRPWQVKTALSTRLTSSVRDISAGSTRSGVAVSDFLRNAVDRLDGPLRLQTTRATAAVLVGGEPSPDLAAVIRDVPEARPGETVLPVAALTARPRDGGCPPLCALAGDDPAAWLAGFAALAVPPLVTLLAWGVALEAHEQNLLLVLDGDRPARLVYRDLADVRVHPERLDAAGLAGHDLPERLRTDTRGLHAKLFGSFVATTLAGLVTTLAAHAPAERLWNAIGSRIRHAYDALPGTPFARADRRALLTAPIPAKPLTLMRLDPATPARAHRPNPFTPREEWGG